MSAGERRSLSRFVLELPIFIRVPRSLGLVEAETRDLSAGGVFFYINSKLAVGTEIEFSIVVPQELTHADAIPVSCKGRVVRVQEAGKTRRVGIAAAIYSFHFLAAASASVD
ncbi:MAG: PilZ domain-containing protein [Acidobacteria bacterium]|nr:PilZ domain-containing protein [Acidobacteriota bacterium]MBV9437469.1 PilZ domain-containing protein [Acidobacteriota bacterium]